VGSPDRRRAPEWRVANPDGALEGTPPCEAGFYHKLCLNSPGVDFLKDHARDIQDTLPVDGLFFDVIQATPCICRWCMAGMGRTWPRSREGSGARCVRRRDATPVPGLHVGLRARDNAGRDDFYNAGHVGPADRAAIDAYTHFELE
jgi:hypothetical protein